MATITSVSQVVQATKAALAAQGPALVSKVKGVISYNLGADSFTVDLKNGSGAVSSGVNKKADLIVTMTEADFLSISNGKLNPQQAFMRGKLKLKGNMALAMKTDAAKKQFLAGAAGGSTGGAAAGGSGGAGGSGLKSAALFDVIGANIAKQGPALVKQVKGVIVFVVSGEKFTIDLKNGSGSVKPGGASKADLTLTVSDDDMVALASGKLNAQQAFMRGKLKLKGNMALAMKLGKVIEAAKPAAKL